MWKKMKTKTFVSTKKTLSHDHLNVVDALKYHMWYTTVFRKQV